MKLSFTMLKYILLVYQEMEMLMSRLSRLLKSPREKDSLRGEELQMKCTKCGKRPAKDPDGLCDHCRFDDILTGMTERE